MAERREEGGGFRGLLEEGIETPGKGIMTETSRDVSRDAVYLTALAVFHVWVGRRHVSDSGQSDLAVWKDRRMQFE